jgi:hypothetical protein
LNEEHMKKLEFLKTFGVIPKNRLNYYLKKKQDHK